MANDHTPLETTLLRTAHTLLPPLGRVKKALYSNLHMSISLPLSHSLCLSTAPREGGRRLSGVRFSILFLTSDCR
jgi:hypothetical protein